MSNKTKIDISNSKRPPTSEISVFDEYNKEKKKQIELLRSADPSYKKYYKDKANQYFNEY